MIELISYIGSTGFTVPIILILIGLLALGLVLGSFVNALVWRFHEQDEVNDELYELQEKQRTKRSAARSKRIVELRNRLDSLSMSRGRSMCSVCSHPLAPKDLIPLVSWLWLRGKCRYCRQPIPDTPWLEACLPAVFIISYVCWPLGFDGYGLVAFCFWLVSATALAALLVYDMRWFLLPDRIVWPLVALTSLQVVLHATVYGGGAAVLGSAFWGVVTASGFFWFLYLLSRGRWIGFGDVKLGIALGLLVGGPLQGAMVVFLASLLGSLASLPLVFKKKLRTDSAIPFGPFLIIATTILVLFGHYIVGSLRSFLLI